ncbi:MAG: zinc ribbon domain-containing protein [Halobacteriota archaeon]
MSKFSSNSLCDDCEEALEHKLPARLANIGESIKASHTCTAEQRETLQHYDRKTSFDFYYDLCYHFSTSNGFKEQDLATLQCVQQATSLPNLHALRARNFAVAAREKECPATNQLTKTDKTPCKFCGVDTPKESRFCAYCGATLVHDIVEEKKLTKDYCKECGKKLPLNTWPFRNICSECLTEEHKRTKGYCKECGKKLPIMRVWNTLGTGYLKDVCSGCEFVKYQDEKLVKPASTFRTEYIGGYGAFPEPKEAMMLTYPGYLEVPELGLTIPYNRLRNVQSMTKESLSAARMLLVGIYAFAWKKNKVYLVITFIDEAGVEQNPVFDVEGISGIQPFLYQQMLKARTLEPATPQPVPQPTSQDDPMEKLAKLKNMVDGGLITEEEYNTKKGEILAKM